MGQQETGRTNLGTGNFGQVDQSRAGETMIQPGDRQTALRAATRATNRVLDETSRLQPGQMLDFLQEFDLYTQEWRDLVTSRAGAVATENGLPADAVMRDYAAKAGVVTRVTKDHGFFPIVSSVTQSLISEGMGVFMTASGSVIATAEGTKIGGYESSGDGLISMTYLTGRAGDRDNKPGSVPAQLPAEHPGRKAEVTVLVKGANGWEVDPGMQIPMPGTVLELRYTNEDNKRVHVYTSPVIAAMYVAYLDVPAQQVMLELEEALEMVHKKTFRLQDPAGTRIAPETQY